VAASNRCWRDQLTGRDCPTRGPVSGASDATHECPQQNALTATRVRAVPPEHRDLRASGGSGQLSGAGWPGWQMKNVLISVVAAPTCFVRSRSAVAIEVAALRHQLAVYQNSAVRPRLKTADRVFWRWLSRAWSGWRNVLVLDDAPHVLHASQRIRDFGASIPTATTDGASSRAADQEASGTGDLVGCFGPPSAPGARLGIA